MVRSKEHLWSLIALENILVKLNKQKVIKYEKLPYIQIVSFTPIYHYYEISINFNLTSRLTTQYHTKTQQNIKITRRINGVY